jgi:hypothetical protein
MFRSVMRLIWAGLWQGFGVEISFLLLWLLWRLAHSRLAHRFDPNHWFHSIHSYFTE